MNCYDATRMIIPTQTGSVVIELDDIVFCRGAGSYTEIALTSNRKILSSRLLKDIERILECKKREYFRIHRSYLININHVVEIKNCPIKKVLMTGLTEIPIAQRKSRDFYCRMKEHYLHLF